MNPTYAQPAYSHNNATATGPGATIDCTSNTEPSSVEIIITGTATVRLECSNDDTNANIWTNANSAASGYTESVFLALPPNVSYFRTNIESLDSGTVTSCFGRGIVKGTVVSAQSPVSMTTGAQ